MGLKIKVKITGYKSKEKMLNYYFASLLRLERKKNNNCLPPPWKEGHTANTLPAPLSPSSRSLLRQHLPGLTLTISLHAGKSDLDSRPWASESHSSCQAPEEQRQEKLWPEIRVVRVRKGSLCLPINISNDIYISIKMKRLISLIKIQK